MAAKNADNCRNRGRWREKKKHKDRNPAGTPMGTAGDRGPVHGGGLVSRSYPCICVSAEDFVQQATRKCHEAAAAAADSSLRCSLLPPPSMHLEDELCQCHRAVLSPRAWLASDHRCRHLSNDDNCFASCSQWNEYCSVSKDCLLNIY
ncbi:hypothetical protein C0Q70_00339 [Pomacea canaliculata]|uniref:Uncharacterized protein n=1 Tax=Pomacea canaliculata TaxID=400727 RepID=A0A2T7PWG7_POMCA|nr:hypothetical protein C0Q70_00339 [Pomacea canaliculata]